MTMHHTLRRIGSALVVFLALGWLLTADYTPMALSALVAFLFVGYVGFRLLAWLDVNRFSPRHLRVGLTWALVGLDPETDEYDRRPVVVYFLMLAILAAGLLLRPFVQWVVT